MPDYFLTQKLIADHTPAFAHHLFDHAVLVVGHIGRGVSARRAQGLARIGHIARGVSVLRALGTATCARMSIRPKRATL